MTRAALTTMKMVERYVLATLLVALCFAFVATDEAKYTQRFDNINVDDILKSERLVNNYIKCMINKGPCTTDAIEMKKNMPDALQNECVKCSDLQREAGAKVFHFMINKKPEAFAEIEKLYDPTGIYRARYYERAQAYELSVREREAQGKPLFTREHFDELRKQAAEMEKNKGN